MAKDECRVLTDLRLLSLSVDPVPNVWGHGFTVKEATSQTEDAGSHVEVTDGRRTIGHDDVLRPF
jgi:hypothetical protein